MDDDFCSIVNGIEEGRSVPSHPCSPTLLSDPNSDFRPVVATLVGVVGLLSLSLHLTASSSTLTQPLPLTPRVLFDNLTKTIAYTLTHLLPELVAVIINILFSIPYAMSSLMILSIDLLSEVSYPSRGPCLCQFTYLT